MFAIMDGLFSIWLLLGLIGLGINLWKFRKDKYTRAGFITVIAYASFLLLCSLIFQYFIW